MTQFYKSNSEGVVYTIEIDNANPEPEKLVEVNLTREEFEERYNKESNWSSFRAYLKLSGFLSKTMETTLPATLGGYLVDALRQNDYNDLVVAVNGYAGILDHGLDYYIEFTDEEKVAVNAAASRYFIGGPIFL